MKKYRFWIIFLISTLSFYLVGVISGSDWQSLTAVVTALGLGLVLTVILNYFYAKQD
jgi:hypothetical protein